MSESKQYAPGTKGTANGGFPATVIRMYSAGMVEVRLPGGSACIPVKDFIPKVIA